MKSKTVVTTDRSSARQQYEGTRYVPLKSIPVQSKSSNEPDKQAAPIRLNKYGEIEEDYWQTVAELQSTQKRIGEADARDTSAKRIRVEISWLARLWAKPVPLGIVILCVLAAFIAGLLLQMIL